MFVAIFEGELGDAGFVEIAEAFGGHAVVLFLRRSRERQIETKGARERESNSAVFGGVGGGEKAAVLAVLHVFAISLEHVRVRAGLRENFSEHRKI